MPFSCAVDDEHKLVTIGFSGRVVYQDVASATTSALESPEFTPRHRFLVDLRSVSEWALSADDIRRLASDTIKRRPESLRTAFVAPSDGVFGDLRMWGGLTRDLHLPRQVFREEASAREWLDSGRLLSSFEMSQASRVLQELESPDRSATRFSRSRS